MVALIKYLASAAVIVSAFIVGGVYWGSPQIAEITAAATTAAKPNRLQAEQEEVAYVGHGSLSPIYPASPGRELRGNPDQNAARIANLHEVMATKPVGKIGAVKRVVVKQAQRTNKLPRQFYALAENTQNTDQQELSYAEEPKMQIRQVNIKAHGLY